jgi:hypothetical protein
MKKWYLSKTVWVNVMGGAAMIVGVFHPTTAALLKEHFAETGIAWTVINLVLRLVTKEELSA